MSIGGLKKQSIAIKKFYPGKGWASLVQFFGVRRLRLARLFNMI